MRSLSLFTYRRQRTKSRVRGVRPNLAPAVYGMKSLKSGPRRPGSRATCSLQIPSHVTLALALLRNFSVIPDMYILVSPIIQPDQLHPHSDATAFDSVMPRASARTSTLAPLS
jgi:hypothetical protein